MVLQDWHRLLLKPPVRVQKGTSVTDQEFAYMRSKPNVKALLSTLATASLIVLAGCDSPSIAAGSPGAMTQAPTAAKKSAPFVTGAGRAQTLRRAAMEDGLMGAISVSRVDSLPDSGTPFVHMFGTSGGDPAMNGLVTYLGFESREDLAAFQIGDFLDYRIKSAKDGRIDLEVDESTMSSGGQIGTQTKRFIVTWPVSSPQNPNVPEIPASITVTPAL
jgi:hypothetical protein